MSKQTEKMGLLNLFFNVSDLALLKYREELISQHSSSTDLGWHF